MIVYLMRHGIAEDFDPANMRADADRRLTKEGREKMVAQASGVQALNLAIDLFISSPYTRARQTAEIVTTALNKTLELAVELVPHAEPEAILEWLAARNVTTDVMLFGHEPHLSSLGALILSGRQDIMIDMKKGSLLGLEIPRLHAPYRGILHSLIPARSLRKMGGV